MTPLLIFVQSLELPRDDQYVSPNAMTMALYDEMRARGWDGQLVIEYVQFKSDAGKSYAYFLLKQDDVQINCLGETPADLIDGRYERYRNGHTTTWHTLAGESERDAFHSMDSYHDALAIVRSAMSRMELHHFTGRAASKTPGPRL